MNRERSKGSGLAWHDLLGGNELPQILANKLENNELLQTPANNSLVQQLRGTKHLTCIHKVFGSNSVDLIHLSVGSVKYNKQSLLSPTVNVASFPDSSPAFCCILYSM